MPITTRLQAINIHLTQQINDKKGLTCIHAKPALLCIVLLKPIYPEV